MNLQQPLVAIHCLVYNHKPYLRDCLEGFVMQQTNFPFVAIVHDDCSTDGSAAIIREYEAKYPDIIKPIYETENQYSKRDGSLSRIMKEAIEATGAKYVAMCEGDDYWTDPLKLQKQVDILEADSECGLVHTNIYHRINDDVYDDHIQRELSSFKEMILGQKISTLTVLIRKDILDKAYQKLNENPVLKSIYMGDYPLFLMISCISKIKFLPIYTGVYRILNNSVSRSANKMKRCAFDLEVIRIKKEFYKYAKRHRFVFCDNLYAIRVKTNRFHSYKRILKTYRVFNGGVILNFFYLLPFALLYKMLNLR